MFELKTNISVRDTAWVQEFCNIVLKDCKFELHTYDKTVSFGIEINVLIKIYVSKEVFEEIDTILTLRSGMTLLDHVNLYCKHPPYFWNKEKDTIEYIN